MTTTSESDKKKKNCRGVAGKNLLLERDKMEYRFRQGGRGWTEFAYFLLNDIGFSEFISQGREEHVICYGEVVFTS